MAAKLVFSAYLAELDAVVVFFEAATRVRPRLNQYICWEAVDQPVRELFTSFMRTDAESARVYQSIVVSVQAGFEQFITDLGEELADAITSRNIPHSDFEKKFPSAIRFFQKSSGYALASVFEPRSHWRMDYERLVSRLSTTVRGSQAVGIYGRTHVVKREGLDDKSLTEMFKQLGIALQWDKFGEDIDLQKRLGVSGKKQCEVRLRERLVQVRDLRNSLAHSQGADDVQIDFLRSTIQVYSRFCSLLSDQVLASAAAA
jgi:hypothetical protein